MWMTGSVFVTSSEVVCVLRLNHAVKNSKFFTPLHFTATEHTTKVKLLMQYHSHLHSSPNICI